MPPPPDDGTVGRRTVPRTAGGGGGPRRRIRRAAVALAVAALVAALAAPAGAQSADGRYRDFGDPGGFRNILPPGQDGVIGVGEGLAGAAGGPTPEHADDQLGPYAALIREAATPGVTPSQLDELFKDASFGVPDDAIGRVYRPGERDDVVVVRDTRDGVPHILGDTRRGAMFARGYTAAEDRLFLMDVLRHLGRAELSVFLGASEANRAMDADQLAAAPYSEEQLAAQIEALRTSDDPALRQVHRDGQAYTAGVNQYITEALTDPSKLPVEYPALQQVPDRWRPTDIIAIASLVGGIFGKGGGREVANYCGLQTLSERLGGAAARRVFDDLKFADDPEAPRTVPRRRFPYMTAATSEAGEVPQLDCDSLRPLQAPPPDDPALLAGAVEDLVPRPPLLEPEPATIDLPWGSMALDLSQPGLSNALLVGASRTDTGTPLAVFGPQTGYYAPQLLSEFDIHAPGISARGVAFAGTDIYVQLGRGRDYAWSATSAGGDLVDEVVLRLCDPAGGAPTVESMGYRHDGRCRPIEPHQEVDLAKPSAGGLPLDPAAPDPAQPTADDLVVNTYFETAPDHGFVTARGTTTDGTPVAIVERRSTYGRELASARGFQQLNDPGFMDDGAADFRRATGDGIDYTFNWFYVDREDIAYQMSCRCPRRAAGDARYLPTWGTGQRDWTGFLTADRLPHVTNPDQGYLISWNNKQARGFASNDGQFGWGPTHRSSLLERRLRGELADPPVALTEAVDVMALAATTDLRAQALVPLLADVMAGRAPADTPERTRTMLERLTTWAGDDLGHRRDHDGDGTYEHAAAVAIMDAWWGGLAGPHEPARVFDAVFADGTADARTALELPVHDPPQAHQGSAFNGTLYAHVHKDLRQVLGRDVTQPLSTTYCGGGAVGACAERLWDSLTAAGAALEQEFDAPAVDDWARRPADDAITHTTLGLTGVPAIDWQNRPTFQQVVQLPREPAGGRSGDGRTGAADPVGAAQPAGPDATSSVAGAGARRGRDTPATGGGAVLPALLLVGLAGLLRRYASRAST